MTCVANLPASLSALTVACEEQTQSTELKRKYLNGDQASVQDTVLWFKLSRHHFVPLLKSLRPRT